MKRKFIKSPILSSITPTGDLNKYKKLLNSGQDLAKNDSFLKWCLNKVIPSAIEEADVHYAYLGGKLVDEMEYREDWDNQTNHYLSVQLPTGTSTYILDVSEEIETIIQCMQSTNKFDDFIECIADKLFIFDTDS